MQKIRCPICGRETVPGVVCSECSLNANGTALAQPLVTQEEVAGWNIERPSPDVLAWARQTFNEMEFQAVLREVEQGGGHQFEDFIEEIERIANGDQ